MSAVNKDGWMAVWWHVDDVMGLDDSLSEEKAREVLELAYRRHDAEIGINWDVLRVHIDDVSNP